MKIRNSEAVHPFIRNLFHELHIFSIQGLTMSAEQSFTACIEAIQYEDGEKIELDSIFPELEVKAKYFLASSLQIPLYFLIFQSGNYFIYVVECSPAPSWKLVLVLDESKFIGWWKSIKSQKQTKPVYEASVRISDSIFDNVLKKHNLAWGGNIDGFMFKEKTFACVIENIFTNKNPLNSPKGEPSAYFHTKGPNYNTWLPTVKLAEKLKVPLFLFTVQGNNQQEKIGFAVIKSLSPDNIHYINGISPDKNILEGKEAIINCINSNIKSSPPRIE